MYVNFIDFNKEKLFFRFHGLYGYLSKIYQEKYNKIKNRINQDNEEGKLTRTYQDVLNLNNKFPSFNKNKTNPQNEENKLIHYYKNQLKELLDWDNNLNSYLNEFLFKSSQLYRNLHKMKKLDKIIKTQIKFLVNTVKIKKEITIPQDNLIAFDTLATSEFISFISPFLHLLYMLQDRFLQILGKILGNNETTDNFRFYCEGYRKTNYLEEFPDLIQELTHKYWDDHADIFREYRNIDEHRYNILNCYGLDENFVFHAYLPDNPRRDAPISYTDKKDVLDILQKEFTAFHDYVDEILSSLNISPKEFKIGTFANQYGENPEKYQKGDCVSMFQVNNKLSCLCLKERNIPIFKEIKFPFNSLRYELRS